MRRAILAACLVAAAAQAGGLLGPPSAWRYYRKGASTPPGPYAWDSAYTNSVLLWEFYTAAEDTSYIGTNSGTLGSGSAAPAKVAYTSDVSASYFFDGVNDWIWRKTVTAFLGTGPRCLSIWIKGTNALTCFSHGNFNTSGELFQLTCMKTSVFFQVDDGNRLFATPLRHRGAWYHLLVGYGHNNTTSAVAWMNGKQLTPYSTAARAIDLGAGTCAVGRSVHPAGASWWAGSVDRPVLYTCAPTEALARSNFWYTAAPMTTNGGHGWTRWDFDNKAPGGLYEKQALACSFNYSSAAADQSTNGNHGTLGASTAEPQWVAPDNNGAREFDGVNDIITYTVAQTKNAYTLWAVTNVAWRHYAELGGTQYVDAVAESFTNRFWFTSGTTVTLGRNASVFGAFTADNYRIFTALTPAELTALKNAGRQ